MKRYEKLGIDFNTVEGLTKIMDINCIHIDDGYGTKGKCKYPKNEPDMCMKCIAERLLEEIPVKKVQRIATYSDASKAWNDYENCNFAMPYSNWLAEEIEVEE